MLKYLFIILLLPSFLYAVDCGNGYDWRAKVTDKNFNEYKKCMSEAEILEGKIFTNKTSISDVHNTYFISYKQQNKCIPLNDYLSGDSSTESGNDFVELINMKFDKSKARYDNKYQRYVMDVKSTSTSRQIIFYPNKTMEEIFKFYNEEAYKLLGGVPDNNAQLIRTSYEPFDFYCCFWPKSNKLFEIDGPNDFRSDRMYIADKSGVYVYLKDKSVGDDF